MFYSHCNSNLFVGIIAVCLIPSQESTCISQLSVKSCKFSHDYANPAYYKRLSKEVIKVADTRRQLNIANNIKSIDKSIKGIRWKINVSYLLIFLKVIDDDCGKICLAGLSTIESNRYYLHRKYKLIKI